MPSTISAGTTAGTAIAVAGDTTGNLAFQTNGTTTAMTIDTSQNVGIGTSSPAFKLDTIVTTGNAVAVRPNNGTSSGLQTAIRLYGHEAVTTSRYAQIGCVNNSGTDVNELAFYTGYATSVTEQARITSDGLLQFNSGYGSVATAFGCRAWVNFDGTGTVAIRASGNVSSITDNGTGDYTVNFSTAMPDANYCATCFSVEGGGGPSSDRMGNIARGSSTYQAGSVKVVCNNINFPDTLTDQQIVVVAVFR
jgi:hypothetical protein